MRPSLPSNAELGLPPFPYGWLKRSVLEALAAGCKTLDEFCEYVGAVTAEDRDSIRRTLAKLDEMGARG